MIQTRPISTRARLAARLADPEMRGAAQLNADAGLIDWMLAAAGARRELLRASYCPLARWSRRAPAPAPSRPPRVPATPRA